MSKNPYEDIAYLREVRQPMDLGPTLGNVTLPARLIEDLDWWKDAWEEHPMENEFFLAQFDTGPLICLLESTWAPAQIHSLNWTLSESQYAEKGDVILPPGYIGFASAFDADGQLALLTNVEEHSAEYGRIYIWHFAWNALGTGDNTRGVGYVAETFRDLVAKLTTEDAL